MWQGLSCDVNTKELEVVDPIHFRTIDRGLQLISFPSEGHHQFFGLCSTEREIILLKTWCSVVNFTSVGCLIIVGNQSHYCGVTSQLNDHIRAMHSHTVISRQEVQERAQDTTLRGTCVDGQCG